MASCLWLVELGTTPSLASPYLPLARDPHPLASSPLTSRPVSSLSFSLREGSPCTLEEWVDPIREGELFLWGALIANTRSPSHRPASPRSSPSFASYKRDALLLPLPWGFCFFSLFYPCCYCYPTHMLLHYFLYLVSSFFLHSFYSLVQHGDLGSFQL